MPAQRLDVTDQVRGGVGVEFKERGGAPASALVELDRFPDIRVRIAPVAGNRAGARPAMQEQKRAPALPAGAFPVERMTVGDRQKACLPRRNLGKQR